MKLIFEKTDIENNENPYAEKTVSMWEETRIALPSALFPYFDDILNTI